MKKILYFLLIVTIIVSCGKETKEEHCESLKNGTFDVYQKDKKVGTVYRKDSIQIEKYEGNKRTGYTKFEQIFKCEFVFRSYRIKQKLDTMHFTVNYKFNELGEAEYLMWPRYVDTNRKLKGKIVKTSDSIKSDVMELFKYLE